MTRHSLRNLLISTAWMIFCCVAAPAQKPAPLPELSHKRLLNDLQITVAATPNLGENMTIGLLVRYGSAYDPADKGGLTNLVSRMFMKATIDKTQKGIQDELEYLGATVDIVCDWDGFRFLLRGPSSTYERSLLLLYQIVCEAQFNEADFAAEKQAILQDLKKPDDPRQRIHAQLEMDLFGGTTYGRPRQGTQASLSSITIGDVRQFYKKYFSPNQAFLLIVGNVPAPEVIQKTARIWGIWVRNDAFPFTFLPPRKLIERRILIEDDPNSPAAQFILGNLFPRREDPDYLPALIAAHVLQERLTKLLPTSLLTVGNLGRRMASPFYVQGQAAAEQTLDHIRKIQNAAAEIKDSSVPAEELAQIQNRLVEEFNRELMTVDGLCKIMLDAELYHLGSNYTANFPDIVRRCDADMVRQAAHSWLFPGGEVILVRGPAAMLKPAMETLGAVQPLAP